MFGLWQASEVTLQDSVVVIPPVAPSPPCSDYFWGVRGNGRDLIGNSVNFAALQESLCKMWPSWRCVRLLSSRQTIPRPNGRRGFVEVEERLVSETADQASAVVDVSRARLGAGAGNRENGRGSTACLPNAAVGGHPCVYHHTWVWRRVYRHEDVCSSTFSTSDVAKTVRQFATDLLERLP